MPFDQIALVAVHRTDSRRQRVRDSGWQAAAKPGWLFR